MAMKDNFLMDTKIGDNVELVIGPKEICGVVIALDLETVRIKRNNGKESVFSLDAITFYEVGETEVPDNDISDEINNKVEVEKKDNRVSIDIAPQDNKVDIIIKNIQERGDSFFESPVTPEVCDVKDVAKMVDDVDLKNDILSIANSMKYAFEQAHEISPADYKIQENITKIKRLIRNNPKSKSPTNMLGAVYFKCKCESLALEAYEGGNDNESAFAVADCLHNEEKKTLFAVRHFIIDKKANAFIYKFLLSKMMEMDDYSLCMKISLKNLTNEKMRAYHSFLRAVFIANEIEYNAMLDFDITENSLDDLLKIFKGKNIGNNVTLLELFPLEKVIVSQERIVQDNRSLEECPIFVDAEHARMTEKNLYKAEKLYIKAIENNEKPGSAVANLYQLLVQKRRFKDCAMYLGRYGSKYMREEAYNNLKKQFFVVAPNMRSEVAKYEKEDGVSIDYFVLAQKAEIEEKDLQKAITYYKKAIEINNRLSSAIPNLVSIYARLEMYKEAMELLNKDGKKAMDKAAYLNLKMSVLIKAKDKQYVQEIEETFNQMIEMTSSIERITELIATKANLLYQVEEYEKAIEAYCICLKNVEMRTFSREKKISKSYMY